MQTMEQVYLRIALEEQVVRVREELRELERMVEEQVVRVREELRELERMVDNVRRDLDDVVGRLYDVERDVSSLQRAR